MSVSFSFVLCAGLQCWIAVLDERERDKKAKNNYDKKEIKKCLGVRVTASAWARFDTQRFVLARWSLQMVHCVRLRDPETDSHSSVRSVSCTRRRAERLAGGQGWPGCGEDRGWPWSISVRVRSIRLCQRRPLPYLPSRACRRGVCGRAAHIVSYRR